MRRLFFLHHLFVAVVLLLCYSESKAQDVLYLYNGDVVNGKLVQIDAGRLKFYGKKVGTINIKLKDIRSIKADVNAVNIELLNSQRLYGWLDTLAPAGSCRFYNLDDTFNLRIDSIVQLTSLRSNFFSRFRGSMSAGLNYSKSSDLLTTNTTIDITYYARKSYVSEKFSGNGSNALNAFKVERASNNLTGLYELNQLVNLIGQFNYYRSIELGIDQRFTLGAGVGNYLYKTKQQNLQAYILVNAMRETELEGVTSALLVQYPIGLEYNLYFYSKHTFQFYMGPVFTVIPSQDWRLRFDLNNTIKYEIVKDLYLDLSSYYNFDSDPSETAAGKVDYGMNLGLSIKF